MSITINQTAFGKTSGSGANPVSATLASAVAQGDTLVAFIGTNDSVPRTVSSVTDSAGNTWTQVPNAYAVIADGPYQSLDIWIATNVASATSLTVTATISGVDGNANFDLLVYDLSACSVGTVGSTTSYGGGSTFKGPSLSPSVVGPTLFLAGLGVSGAPSDTVQAPWTQSSGGSGLLTAAYVSESSTGTSTGAAQQPVWTVTAGAIPAVCSVVVLIGNNGPGGGFPPPEYGYGYGQVPQAAKPAPAPKFYSGGWSFGKPPGPVFNSGGNK